MPAPCSECGKLTDSFARGGGPNNRRCSDCSHIGKESPYTIGPPANPYSAEDTSENQERELP